MRWRALIATAGAVFAVGAAVAWADPADIKSLPDSDDYELGSYSHDSGTIGMFSWQGGESHNVTANQKGPDGKALFRSKTIGAGSTLIQGTQYVPDGTYNFFCTTHGHSMQADLVVSGGVPLARPTVSVDAILAKKVKKTRKAGKVVVHFTTTADGLVKLTAKLGNRTIGRGDTADLGTSGNATIKLSKPGKNLLKGRKKATIKVTAGVDFGSPDSLSRKLT